MDPRARRTGERIRQLVAELLADMKDPRIGFVTVTDVRVTSDHEHAEVFFTTLPDDEASVARTLAGLDSATPALQRELGARLRTRATPRLRFTVDPVPAHGRHIERLIATGGDPGDEPLPEPGVDPRGRGR